jgi:hypothetical protein
VNGTVFTPDGDGTMSTTATIPAAGSYRVWVGGDIYSKLTVTAGGQSASVRQAINVNRYQPFGPFQLEGGSQEIQFTHEGASLAPGSGTEPSPLGPVILEPVHADDLGTVQVPASGYQRLCNRSWDWIEAYG